MMMMVHNDGFATCFRILCYRYTFNVVLLLPQSSTSTSLSLSSHLRHGFYRWRLFCSLGMGPAAFLVGSQAAVRTYWSFVRQLFIYTGSGWIAKHFWSGSCRCLRLGFHLLLLPSTLLFVVCLLLPPFGYIISIPFNRMGWVVDVAIVIWGDEPCDQALVQLSGIGWRTEQQSWGEVRMWGYKVYELE